MPFLFSRYRSWQKQQERCGSFNLTFRLPNNSTREPDTFCAGAAWEQVDWSHIAQSWAQPYDKCYTEYRKFPEILTGIPVLRA